MCQDNFKPYAFKVALQKTENIVMNVSKEDFIFLKIKAKYEN